MRYPHLMAISLLILASIGNPLLAQVTSKEYVRSSHKMGSYFEVIAIDTDSIHAHHTIDLAFQEIERIEQLISSWLPTSQTNHINKNAGMAPVAVDRELYDLIYRCIKISELTQGAYDISFAGMDDIWVFEGQEIHTLPDSQQVTAASNKANYHNIVLNSDRNSVFLSKIGMKIGFGSIGKGYAANRAMEILKEQGVHSGMINAGGDLISWGTNKDGEAWSVGIANPEYKHKIIGWLALENVSLVTSGDYEKFFTFKKQRFGHIIDPRTGYPAKGIKSVSILCPDAELADALATAVYVLGGVQGLELVNQLIGVEGLLITTDDQILMSDNLELSLYSINK